MNVATHSLDSVGNRNSVISTLGAVPSGMWTYNADDQISSETYDANGSTLSDGTNTYVWDARNRLVSADNNGATFAYDPLVRRVAKTILSTSTNFLYDGANPVQELNGATPTANLLTGGIDERFTRTDATLAL